MRTYKNMSRKELISKIVDARVAQCKKENEKKFSDGLARKNENKKIWENLYKSYPITSKTTPSFSLSAEYDRYYA